MKLFFALIIVFSFPLVAQEETQQSRPLMGGMTEAEIEEAIRNNPMQHMTPEQVRQLIHQNYDGTPMGNFLNRFPRFEEFLVHFFQDEAALPGLLIMSKEKTKLRNLSLFCLVIVILGFYYSAVITRDDRSILKRWAKKFTLRLCVLCLTFFLTYWNFKAELSPTLRLIKIHLLKLG